MCSRTRCAKHYGQVWNEDFEYGWGNQLGNTCAHCASPLPPRQCCQCVSSVGCGWLKLPGLAACQHCLGGKRGSRRIKNTTKCFLIDSLNNSPDDCEHHVEVSPVNHIWGCLLGRAFLFSLRSLEMYCLREPVGVLALSGGCNFSKSQKHVKLVTLRKTRCKTWYKTCKTCKTYELKKRIRVLSFL